MHPDPHSRSHLCPKNKVSYPITDQEIAFARLVLSRAMTHRQAAEAIGLNPDSAAYTKSKPASAPRCSSTGPPCSNSLSSKRQRTPPPEPNAKKHLDRLWEIANLSPDMTRGSVTGKVKALSMIVAIEGLIPDRRAISSERNPPPHPPGAQIYASAWCRGQDATTAATTNDPQPTPAPGHQQDQQEDSPAVTHQPACQLAARRLLTLAPASPTSPTALPPRKLSQPSPMSPGSLLFQTREVL